MTWLALVLLLQAGTETPVVQGLDHVIVLVEDLEAATARFEALGFVSKSGRQHKDGIVNRHIKFPDGTELELLSLGKVDGPLARSYRDKLERAGPGPVYAGLFMQDRKRLLSRLEATGWVHQPGRLVTFAQSSSLSWLFFGERNHSPSDRPEHFRHGNRALSLAGVWVVPEDREALAGLLTALGAVRRTERMDRVEVGLEVPLYGFPEGFIAVLPDRFRQVSGRSVVGVTLNSENPSHPLLRPEQTLGLWIEFRPLLPPKVR